jgi:hypothetical protein
MPGRAAAKAREDWPFWRPRHARNERTTTLRESNDLTGELTGRRGAEADMAGNSR